MGDNFKIGQLVKFKNEKLYVHHWKNPQKIATLPPAGIILELKVEDWFHPFYNLSDLYEKKELQTLVAKVKWFEYNIPEIGKSDEQTIQEYNKNYSKIPVSQLVDFNNYVERLKKKKELYK